VKGPLAAVSLLVATAVQAQSSYTLTTLKTANNVEGQPMVLDSQNNVVGAAPYYAGLGSVTQGKLGVRLLGTFGMLYNLAPARWPASTAASVMPTRLGRLTGMPTAISPNGSKFAMGADVYDSATGKLVYAQPTVATPTVDGFPVSQLESVGRHRLLDDGSLVLNFARETNEGVVAGFGLWSGSANGRALLMQPVSQGRVLALTATSANEVAGWASQAGDDRVHAAYWSSGQLQVLDTRPDRSTVTMRTALGLRLICEQPLTRPSPSYLDGGRPFVIGGGVVSDIAPLNPGELVSARGLNNQGFVVGASGPQVTASQVAPQSVACSDTTPKSSRAIIWQYGKTHDLNEWVASRGLKLPAGSVLAEALDINAQNSILAVLRAANGSLSYVRLTAQP
jgi:hypothetical protein